MRAAHIDCDHRGRVGVELNHLAGLDQVAAFIRPHLHRRCIPVDGLQVRGPCYGYGRLRDELQYQRLAIGIRLADGFASAIVKAKRVLIVVVLNNRRMALGPDALETVGAKKLIENLDPDPEALPIIKLIQVGNAVGPVVQHLKRPDPVSG